MIKYNNKWIITKREIKKKDIYAYFNNDITYKYFNNHS